ncbi:hypothetical protein B0I27_11118 [Arcticibacter pallidicorallinus]|uniref:Uncharacterized protein n=1 Tax=Arcticibacter pallidicorallinus TaxID=1259464 RepID=A0A2T0TUS9_9SPHI|nr:hypothetical protein B0I27_11118 [Arcticibacter pallidicorallinus]
MMVSGDMVDETTCRRKWDSSSYQWAEIKKIIEESRPAASNLENGDSLNNGLVARNQADKIITAVQPRRNIEIVVLITRGQPL